MNIMRDFMFNSLCGPIVHTPYP
ncbi:hypothetical protein ACTIVE_7981 [Actinomadura verrucosospora]|uniref:Uncharacterized protein n=1 Tax=Actinomadura verrucosospora TaxID=46165 RepID=A0A7D4AUL2_ACTVE|nr:hypothetical protein ACTIVE_7981 [Actinomadura verrucosospora]